MSMVLGCVSVILIHRPFPAGVSERFKRRPFLSGLHSIASVLGVCTTHLACDTPPKVTSRLRTSSPYERRGGRSRFDTSLTFSQIVDFSDIKDIV